MNCPSTPQGVKLIWKITHPNRKFPVSDKLDNVVRLVYILQANYTAAQKLLTHNVLHNNNNIIFIVHNINIIILWQ